MMRMHSRFTLATLAYLLSSSAYVLGGTINSPSPGDSVYSFSGAADIPVSYTPDSGESYNGTIDIRVVTHDYQGRGQDYTYYLANGLERSSDDGGNGTFSVHFSPSGGYCGDVTLQIFETASNSSSPDEVDFTVTCAPIQLALPSNTPKERRELHSRAGPSGTLQTPSGGNTYQPTDSIQIAYQGVDDHSPGNSAVTFAIDALLVGSSQNYTLTNGLWKAQDASVIGASFALPDGACGDFNLQVTEHQVYGGGAIAFVSASPSVTILCDDSTGGTSNSSTSAIGAAPTNSTSSSVVATSTNTSVIASPTNTSVIATPTNSSTSSLRSSAASATNVSSSTTTALSSATSDSTTVIGGVGGSLTTSPVPSTTTLPATIVTETVTASPSSTTTSSTSQSSTTLPASETSSTTTSSTTSTSSSSTPSTTSTSSSSSSSLTSSSSSASPSVVVTTVYVNTNGGSTSPSMRSSSSAPTSSGASVPLSTSISYSSTRTVTLYAQPPVSTEPSDPNNPSTSTMQVTVQASGQQQGAVPSASPTSAGQQRAPRSVLVGTALLAGALLMAICL